MHIVLFKVHNYEPLCNQTCSRSQLLCPLDWVQNLGVAVQTIFLFIRLDVIIRIAAELEGAWEG